VSLLLRLAGLGLPAALRRRKARELYALTAGCFGVSWPSGGPPGPGSELERFAVLTRGLVDKFRAEGKPLAPVKADLRGRALAFGRNLRRSFRVRHPGDAVRLLRLAYAAVGIDLRAGEGGAITVSRCFFSRHYTPETCRVIASLDEGLMAGILGEGGLEFTCRITEGHKECRAVFRLPGDGP